MSYYAYDVDGYVGDLTDDNDTWFNFADWASKQGSELGKLGDEGLSEDLPVLRKQMDETKADDETNQEVLDDLKKLAKNAKAILIISDGIDAGEAA